MSLFYTLIIFAIAFLIHLTIWKIHLPKKQTNTLLLIFFGTLIIGFFYLKYSGVYLPNVVESLRIFILFTSLTLGYIITYSALEVDSPSLVFISNIADAGSKGLSKAHFNQLMTDELLIKPRIKDLVRDKFVVKIGEKYKLTTSGRIFISLFTIYRKLLNAPRGG